MSGDAGRQPERTRLAWRRAVLGYTGVALLTGRLAIVESNAPLALAAVLLLWLAVLALSWRRILALGAAAPAPARRAVPLTAGAAVCLAGLGAILVLGL